MICPICRELINGNTYTIRITWDNKVNDRLEITSHPKCSDELYPKIQQENIDKLPKAKLIEKYNLYMGE